MTSEHGGDSLRLDARSSDDLLTTEAAATVLRAPAAWRRLVEWSPTSAPVALLLLMGIALGPHGVNLLSRDTLSVLAPVIPVALAALAVLIALSAESGRADDRRVFGWASLLAGLTMLVVSGGLAILALTGTLAVAPLWAIVIGAGLCAASSVTLPSGPRFEHRSRSARLIELGVLLPILSGGIVMAWLRGATPLTSLLVLLAAAALTCGLAVATWLLLTSASSETEERVITVSALLLVGGLADALSQSALLMGVLAGWCWRYGGKRAAGTIGRDVLFVQHPLLVLVLLAAGASAAPTAASVALGVAYFALRIVGQVAGGLLARLGNVSAQSDLPARLLAPGVFGVAFALNLASVGGGDTSTLLSAVVVGTMGSDVVAAFVPARRVGA